MGQQIHWVINCLSNKTGDCPVSFLFSLQIIYSFSLWGKTQCDLVVFSDNDRYMTGYSKKWIHLSEYWRTNGGCQGTKLSFTFRSSNISNTRGHWPYITKMTFRFKAAKVTLTCQLNILFKYCGHKEHIWKQWCTGGDMRDVAHQWQCGYAIRLSWTGEKKGVCTTTVNAGIMYIINVK